MTAEKPPEPQPKTWNGVTYDYYDATQEQRRREREIRALKRQASAEEAAGLTDRAKATKSLLKQKSAEYREFSEAMDISPKPNRLRVVESKIGNSGTNSPLTNLGRNAKMEPDIEIFRSVGAKLMSDFEVLDLQTGTRYHFVNGSHLKNVEAFAGKGSKTPYRNAAKYADKYGGDPSDWQHVKANGEIETDDGYRRAEVHWSRCKDVGDFDFFIKKWFDD